MTTPLVIRNILFATDFSDASRLAGQTAADARHFEARLHILHVIPLVTDPTGASEALRAEAAELERGLSIVTACTSGRVARRIVEYAGRNAIDLIVLGTHGRTGVSRALLGSVAEAVIRRAQCRVLAVPATTPDVAAAVPTTDVVDETTSCTVCGAATQDELICEPCRARIRGEALHRKLREERAGH
jgi:nucleotide-binding universal stress UspA family protein